MKEGHLIETVNVRECRKNIETLRKRPKMDMVGLGLFYGETGLGKTTFANRIAHSSGHVYQRLTSTSTQKSFLSSLYSTLTQRYAGRAISAVGSANRIFGMCCALLEDHEDAVVFVDELNYAFTKPQLLDTIRDIVDETLAVIILVGEDKSHERLLKHNRRYFDRCNAFYEFRKLTPSDIRAVCAELLEVNADPAVANWVYNRTKDTNFREVMKTIRLMEEYAAFNHAETLTLDHCIALGQSIDKSKDGKK
jgi:replication-associated recombination protein RarA